MNPSDQLQALARENLLRTLHCGHSPSATIVSRDGKELWNFSSNDYLGLSKHPAVAAAFIEAIRTHGTGAAASRLITGTYPPHLAFEQSIAAAKGAEAALTFGSGFATALSSIPVIVGKGDLVFLDRLAHASLIDAARISGATVRIFPHNDFSRLTELLAMARARHATCRILVITESVFSMDGDLCPLREIIESCEQYGADLFLDEAHAVGVLGPQGMGLAEALGLQGRIAFQMGTMSKALGLSGGYLAASRGWIDLIVNRARPFIYTTAPPPAIAHASLEALRIIRSEEGATLRKKLFQHISLLRPGHQSAIIPHVLGNSEAALRAAENMREHGYLIPAIRFPTVPKHSARLRITLSACHSVDAINGLAALLKKS